MNRDLETQITELIRDELLAKNCEIFSIRVHRAGHRQIVSMKVDYAEGGITMEECACWNRILGDFLEKSRLLENSYVVEVSSPGVDWPLRSEKDFRRLTGQRVSIRCREGAGDSPVEGVVRGADDGAVLIDIEPEGLRRIRIQDIVSARAVVLGAGRGGPRHKALAGRLRRIGGADIRGGRNG